MKHMLFRSALVGALVGVGACGTAPSPDGTQSVPETGQIIGQVVDAYTDAPIVGARVGLREGERTITDAQGRFVLANVPVGVHRVVASADDYIDGARANVEVMAGDETLIAVRLFQSDPSPEAQREWMQRQQRDPAAPTERTPDPEGEVGEVGSTTSALEEPLPEMIRVWRSQGTPLAPSATNGWADRSCDGRVQVLPLAEYVKGVIPHEWVPSWHPEALRAGAIAARSYAASHAAGGGRWDCADVDDGTVTQVYRDDRAGPTDEAVDATRGVVVERDGRIVRAEYSAENGHPTAGHDIDDPVCAGSTLRGHGRGACQWGTQRWASGTCFEEPCSFGVHGSDPKDHVWMMEHYFPGTILSTGEPAAPCALIGSDGGILDDAGPCFVAYGPPEYWRTESAGHEGGLHWTNAYESDSPSNWAAWTVVMENAGEFRVDVHVVDAFAEYPAARYEVRHDGEASEVIVDLGAASDGWLELGAFAFAAGGDQRVALFDNYSGAVPADQHLVADAVRLTPTSAPADAGVGDAATDAGAFDGAVADASGDDAGPERRPGDLEPGCGCAVAGGEVPSYAWAIAALALGIRRLSRAV